MSDFYQAIPIIIKHEGGYVNHKSDPGGMTNYGVSFRFLKQSGLLYNELDDIDLDIDNDGDVDEYDMRHMLKSTAIKIYKEYWWDKYGYGRIHEQAIATKCLDGSVNMGNKQYSKIIQRALNSIGNNLIVDGIIGPKTIGTINTYRKNAPLLLTKIQKQHAAFYKMLIQRKPKFAVFETGWMRRAYA